MWEADDQYCAITAGSIDGTDCEAHDKAITRAINTHYNPKKDTKIKGDPFKTLFVARLSPRTSEDTLRQIFEERFGRVDHCRLVRGIVSGISRRYAFISFQQESSFRDAFLNGHHMIIDDARIIVDYERERRMLDWKPRRLGGGFGGRKESGQLRFGGRERPFRRPIVLPGNHTKQIETILKLRQPPLPRSEQQNQYRKGIDFKKRSNGSQRHSRR